MTTSIIAHPTWNALNPESTAEALKSIDVTQKRLPEEQGKTLSFAQLFDQWWTAWMAHADPVKPKLRPKQLNEEVCAALGLRPEELEKLIEMTPIGTNPQTPTTPADTQNLPQNAHNTFREFTPQELDLAGIGDAPKIPRREPRPISTPRKAGIGGGVSVLIGIGLIAGGILLLPTGVGTFVSLACIFGGAALICGGLTSLSHAMHQSSKTSTVVQDAQSRHFPPQPLRAGADARRDGGMGRARSLSI